MRYYRAEDGERLPGDEMGLGITRPEWHEFLDGLLELNAAGALPGIRAIIDERLLMIKAGADPEIPRPDGIASLVAAGAHGIAAALLAAEIDRQAQP